MYEKTEKKKSTVLVNLIRAKTLLLILLFLNCLINTCYIGYIVYIVNFLSCLLCIIALFDKYMTCHTLI